jgi:hypothetical protein
MEHSGANNHVERAPKLFDARDRELMKSEVLEVGLALKFARVAQAGFADVDRHDSSLWLDLRVPRRLRRPAAGDQDFPVSPRPLGGPDQMKLGPATIRVLVEVAVCVRDS